MGLVQFQHSPLGEEPAEGQGQLWLCGGKAGQGLTHEPQCWDHCAIESKGISAPSASIPHNSVPAAAVKEQCPEAAT